MIYNIFVQYGSQIIIGLLGLSLLLSLIALVRLRSLNKKYRVFMDALSGKDIEKLLLEHMETVKIVKKENEEQEAQIKELKNAQKSCFQKHGIVRYTAFDDVGSDLSFAIALLDGKDDGIILNGIYSREGSSMYAKAVHDGETKQNLSDEEKKALENAKRKG